MKIFVRPLLLAPTFAAALASCSSSDKPGQTNFEDGAAQSVVPTKEHPTTRHDSAKAGLHRNDRPRPTAEQLYDNANQAVDRNHDGKAD